MRRSGDKTSWCSIYKNFTFHHYYKIYEWNETKIGMTDYDDDDDEVAGWPEYVLIFNFV